VLNAGTPVEQMSNEAGAEAVSAREVGSEVIAKDTHEQEIQAGDGVIPLSLEEIEACNLAEMAKDKFKSRQLQRSLARGGQEHTDLIFVKAEPHIMELVKDQHGNYLLQKIMEVVKTEQFDIVFSSLKDDLMALAKDTHGTRGVQKIVEQAIVRDRVEQLMEALPADQAEELARNITGFHVIVKLLDSLPSDRTSTLLERLCGDSDKVLALGKDQWGCCVLKKCLDRADGAMKERMVDSIGQHALPLVQDAFGNYVVQHLILNRAAGSGPNPNVGRLIDGLKGHVFELSLQKYSSNVLEKCLANSTDKDRNKIINEILNPPDNMKPSEAVHRLLFHQFGNYVFQQALEVAKDPQFSLLIEHSKQHIQELYIEYSKQNSQGAQKDAEATQIGDLPAEHTQRLAVKLVKRYPGLTEGMDMSSIMLPSVPSMDASWMFDSMNAYDPMSYGMMNYGMVDAFGFPYMMDPYYGMGNFAYPQFMNGQKGQASKGGRGSNQGRRNGQKPGGQKGKGGAGKGGDAAGKGMMAAPGAADETVRVGRIVGFWPNYEITYDEVPPQGGGKGGGRTKNNHCGGDRGRQREGARRQVEAKEARGKAKAAPAAAAIEAEAA